LIIVYLSRKDDYFMFTYIGNGAYCYANSTSMLLETIGEKISPETIESYQELDLGLSGLKRTI
jgi:hypothetical protein